MIALKEKVSLKRICFSSTQAIGRAQQNEQFQTNLALLDDITKFATTQDKDFASSRLKRLMMRDNDLGYLVNQVLSGNKITSKREKKRNFMKVSCVKSSVDNEATSVDTLSNTIHRLYKELREYASTLIT